MKVLGLKHEKPWSLINQWRKIQTAFLGRLGFCDMKMLGTNSKKTFSQMVVQNVDLPWYNPFRKPPEKQIKKQWTSSSWAASSYKQGEITPLTVVTTPVSHFIFGHLLKLSDYPISLHLQGSARGLPNVQDFALHSPFTPLKKINMGPIQFQLNGYERCNHPYRTWI